MERSAQATDTPFDAAINDIPINGMTPATKTIQAFALAITQMSRQSLERTTEHMEKLRKVHCMEEVMSIQQDFVKDLWNLRHNTQEKWAKCWRPSRLRWPKPINRTRCNW